jgi:hypothetical protein
MNLGANRISVRDSERREKKERKEREREGRKKARKVYGYFHEDTKKQYYFLFEKFKRQ